MIHVDASHNGGEVTLEVGEVVEISLAENRTTGFRWEIKSQAEPACALVNSTFEAAVSPPGKGGTHRWQFQAEHQGIGEIALEYRRAWDPDVPPRQSFRLNVTVRERGSSPSSTARSE